MSYTVVSFAVVAVLVSVPAMSGAADAPALEKKTFTDPAGKTLPYRLLKPESYDPKQKYPLVIFLHGAGERGNNNEAQLVHGVPEFAKPENRQKYPCFLIAPQCPRGDRWADWDAKQQTSKPLEPLRLVSELIDQVQKEYSIDPNRIYVTGLSMGGYGTWDLIERYPDRFAAAVPICGGGDPSKAATIAKLPIWAFHGGKDPVVKPELSRTMVEALKKAGGQPKYTEYPDVAHDSWVPAYREPEMFAWLFAQKRK